MIIQGMFPKNGTLGFPGGSRGVISLHKGLQYDPKDLPFLFLWPLRLQSLGLRSPNSNITMF